MKRIYYILLICSVPIAVFAQKTHQDSIIRVANLDAKRHKISGADFKEFRKDRGNFNAEYFRPDSSTASNVNLLKDSTYVQAFRTAMYKKTRTRRTAGHYILVGGAIYTGASFIAGLVIIIALSNGFN
ncbi:MAG: hypothetical protein EOO88_23005 [Pedobacter sp.]|nr:MAG: hypothetical protein EOO88_23005 [Pedobacter sp.]